MKPFVAIFLPLLVAYATALGWCVDRWNAPTEYFAHCWLLPFVAAGVIWLRRRRFCAQRARVDRRGWWLLGPGLLLHLAGAALMIDSWSAASLVLTVPGAAWLGLGSARLRGLWPVVMLVLFVVPMPIYVEGRMAFVLKEIAVQVGSWSANLLGADVARVGDRLVPAGLDGSLYVADACSGLRSLLAMLTLAYCLAFFTGSPDWRRRALLLAVAAPLAVAANCCRIAVLCLLARWYGVGFAEGTGHTIANVFEWLVLLALLFGIDSLLARAGFRSSGSASSAVVPDAAPADATGGRTAVGLVGPAILLWLSAGPLLWLSSYRPFAERTDRAQELPEQIGAYTLQRRTPSQQAEFEANLPRWRELLGTRDFVYRTYLGPDRRVIRMVALYHDSNWKSVHPPRICIEGSDQDILVDDLQPAPWLDLEPDPAVSRIVAQDRGGDRWRYVTLSLFGTASWASGDYWDFTMHHLPRALLRQNESGFLLRVETPIYRGEQPDRAEARCAEFLAALLPVVRAQLR